MDAQPPAATATATGMPTEPAAPAPPVDRLGAEVRESAVLLVLSLAVTAGISGVAQTLLTLAG